MVTVSLHKENGTRYLSHGIKTEEGGYFGTTDNGWSFRSGELFEISHCKWINPGDQYRLEINGRFVGIKTR